MTRSQLREDVFKGLFRVEFHDGEEIEEQLKIFIDSEQEKFEDEEDELPPMKTQDAVYVKDKLEDIIRNIPELDRIINEASDRWPTERMNKADLAILRLAVYEIRMEQIDVGIAINEAVNLARSYGEEGSYKFVNGILGKIAN